MKAMATTDKPHDSEYLRAYNGLLRGILRWPELDTVWARLHDRNDGGAQVDVP